MKLAGSVTEYLDNNPKWHAELDYLRNLVLSTECIESLKWGMPVYAINKKNVVGIGAFKNYVGLWFYQGVFLTDHAQVLHNAQEGVTKAMRQWRFSSIEEMDPNLILDYLYEAIQNQKDGKEMKPTKKAAVQIPEELKRELDTNKELSDGYFELSSSKQREYCEFIGSAKKTETRIKRLDKSIPLILKGKGLNDKYRK